MKLCPVTAEEFSSVYDELEEAFPPEERRDREEGRH